MLEYSCILFPNMPVYLNLIILYIRNKYTGILYRNIPAFNNMIYSVYQANGINLVINNGGLLN